MSARTVQQITDELARMIPAHTAGPAEPLIGGAAAVLQAAESAGYDAAATTTIGGADGKWLDLMLRGVNSQRADGETDASVRARLRDPQLGITRANIKAVVDAILSAFGVGECLILEWFEGPALDRDFYLDYVSIIETPNWFLIVVPSIAENLTTSYLDSTYMDRDMYLGDWVVDPAVGAYAAINAAVHLIRAAGIRWALYVDTTGVYL